MLISGYAQDYDAELTFHKTNISVKQNRMYKTSTFEIKIYNRAGEKFTEVSIPYSEMDKVSKIEASIRDRNGNIVKKLKRNDISDRSAFSNGSFYQDYYLYEFTLKHNSYPYTLVYSYQRLQKEFFYLTDWTPVLRSNIPTRKALLNIEVPLDFKIHFDHYLIDNFVVDTLDESIIYSWLASYENTIDPEIYSERRENYFPNVAVVPGEFIFDIEGSYDSWESYGDYQFQLIQGLSELPASEQNRIRSLTRDIDSELEKIKILYHYLQDQTRYVNITIETGGLKPYPASYVAENKYGDCKALSNYFKSVLEYAGIKSNYTLVYASDDIKEIDKNFPSQQFNHVILSIPMDDDTLWLDCTSDGPFNQLGTFTQNRDAFVIDSNSSHFTRTPPLLMNEVIDSRTVVFRRDKNRRVVADFRINYHGEDFESLSGLSRQASETSLARIIRNYFIEDGFELIDFELIESPRDAREITLTYSAFANKVYNSYGSDIMLDMVPFYIPLFEEPEKRKLGVKIDYPINYIDTINYYIPEGYNIPNKLENKSIQNEYGEYTLRSQQESDRLTIVKRFLLNTGKYSLEEYPDFYKFIDEVYDIENSPAILLTRNIQNRKPINNAYKGN